MPLPQVLTTNLYQDRLERDSIRPIVVPYTAFQSAALPDGWLGLMSSNGVSAVVLEREVLQYVDYTSTCKLRWGVAKGGVINGGCILAGGVQGSHAQGCPTRPGVVHCFTSRAGRAGHDATLDYTRQGLHS